MGHRNHGVAACGPGTACGMAGSRILAPEEAGPRPHGSCCMRPIILQATDIGEWERDAAKNSCLRPGGEGVRLTVAHF